MIISTNGSMTVTVTPESATAIALDLPRIAALLQNEPDDLTTFIEDNDIHDPIAGLLWFIGFHPPVVSTSDEPGHTTYHADCTDFWDDDTETAMNFLASHGAALRGRFQDDHPERSFDDDLDDDGYDLGTGPTWQYICDLGQNNPRRIEGDGSSSPS